MIHQFFHDCIPPTTTAQVQGRRRYRQPKVELAKAFWLAVMMAHKPERPMIGPLRCEINIYWPYTAKQINRSEKAPIMKITKPDCDNLMKAPQDAMQVAGFFQGDQIISDLHILKWNFSITGITITITELDDYGNIKP